VNKFCFEFFERFRSTEKISVAARRQTAAFLGKRALCREAATPKIYPAQFPSAIGVTYLQNKNQNVFSSVGSGIFRLCWSSRFSMSATRTS
jgi:hypothetical protein